MKTKAILYSLSALFLCAMISVGCTKDQQQKRIDLKGKKIVFSATKQQATATKTTYEYVEATKGLDVKWAEGDAIAVTFDCSSDYAGMMETVYEYYVADEISSSGKGAKFVYDGPGGSSSIDSFIDESETIYVHYPKGTTTDGMKVSYDISSQEGDLANLGKYDLMSGSVDMNEGFESDDEMIFNVSFKSDVSILRIAKGTSFITSSSASLPVSVSLSSPDIRSKVEYAGSKKTTSVSKVTVNNVNLNNGKLEEDLYIAFMNSDDATSFEAHEYKITVETDEATPKKYEATLTKKPSAAGKTPFNPGVVYTLTKLNLTEVVESSGSYTLRILTFEDSDYVGSEGANYWSGRIDNPQYGGPLLYPEEPTEYYMWYDEDNTELMSMLPDNWGDGKYWGGGHAVSNYVREDYVTTEEDGYFMYQLSVPVGGGHNGSSNFCVHFGYHDNSGWSAAEDKLPYIVFSDGVERIIDHMWVTNTTYMLNSLLVGDRSNPPIEEGQRVYIEAIGYDADQAETKRTRFTLADGPDGILKEWAKWDLVSLGKVAMVRFNVVGYSGNDYGYTTPGYFAYDDVAVRFED